MNKILQSVLLVVSTAVLVASASAADPKQVEVTAERSNVMSGSDVIGTVTKGQTLTVLSEQTTWYQIEIETGGQKRKGWIRQADAKTVAKPIAVAAAAPDTMKKWLRVTAERAELKAGTVTVATLARNRVMPIASVDGKWQLVKFFEDGESRVGYVLNTGFELLDERVMGPSLDDFTPFAIAPATTAVNWSTNDVTITAAVPIEDPSTVRLLSADGHTPAPETFNVQASAGSVTIRAPGSAWSELPRTDTRSLWLAEGNADQPRMHRIDLPAVELGTSVIARRIKDFDEGLLVSLPTSGLLPGYLIEHAYRTSDGRTSRPQVLLSSKGASPRFADVIAGTADWPDTIRVVVPFATEPTEAITHLFVVRHLDGSQTRTISVQRRGDTITAAASEVAAAERQPVDVVVNVPSVELLTASQGAKAITAAGLQPLFVDQQTFQPRKLDEVLESTVLRQGVSTGERLLVGSPVLLGLRDDQGLTLLDSTSLGLVDERPNVPANQPADQPADPATPQTPPDQPETNEPEFVSGGLGGAELLTNSTTVNTGEELQFVDVNQSGLVGGSGGLQGAGGGDPITGDGFVTGGLLTDSTLGTDPATGSGDDLPPDLLVPVNPDPGVLLDPTVDSDTALLTGILKIVIDAILNQPDPANLPGPIGQAITDALSKFEKPLTTAANPAAELQAVTGILEIVLDKLQLALTDPLREKALGAWTNQRQRNPRKPIDRNGNTVAADDVVLFFVVWLHRHGSYNPASNVVIAQDGLGNTVATMSNTPVSLDWLKNLPPIVKPGQSSPPIVVPPGAGTKPKPQPVDPLASVPQGKPVVSAGAGPNLVKVPEMNQKSVGSVKPVLDDLGIKIGNLAELFSTDRIVDSDLVQGEWVKADSTVVLQVVRAVPNLVKRSLSAADAELKQHKLTSSTVGKTFSSDIVIEQEPAAGEFISPGKPVKLALAIVAPQVTGMLLAQAREVLTTRDLKVVSRTRAFDVDKVVSQTPPPGALVGHGDGIELTLHLPVPNFAGLTLGKAREVAKEWDLALVVDNRFARDADTVRGQSPPAKSFVLHESDLKVGPVVTRVPDLRGISVEKAEATLTAADFDSKRFGDIIATDQVTMQNPAPGTEHERGQPITLDARVKLPNYVGTGIVAARDGIARLGGNLRSKVDGPIGRADLVHSQQPAGDSFVYPRTEVDLVAGVNLTNMAGLSTAQADAELQRLGLKGTLQAGRPIETTDPTLVNQRVVGGQNPNPGFYRRSDLGVVQLSVNTYVAAMRTVPNVDRNQAANAIAAIQRAELKPVIVFRRQNYDPASWTAFLVLEQIRIAAQEDKRQPNFVVTSQSPEAGKRVLAGSPVQIFVSDLSESK